MGQYLPYSRSTHFAALGRHQQWPAHGTNREYSYESESTYTDPLKT